jgi:S-methylmethionine-dependent homocysteine/selenocysteine methylase
MSPSSSPAPRTLDLDRPFLTDGGMETSLIYLSGLDLPAFASFPLLETADGREAITSYFKPYLDTARSLGTGFIFETATWRANLDWAASLGYDRAAVDRINRDAVAFARELEGAAALPGPTLVSGCIGPRGDGYVVNQAMSEEDAAAYHDLQVIAFAESGADLVTATTMNYAEEAIGIAQAAARREIPAVISFTVETDGRLPSGESLPGAIARTDAAAPGAISHFMINCAHPTHFDAVLADGGSWASRIRGIRANASTMSHAELDVATELDAGDQHDLAARYVELRRNVPSLAVFGGCCGTDDRHVTAIGAALA